MSVNPKIPIKHDFLKDAKVNSPQGEKSVFYNSTNQFQQYYDDDDDDNDNDNDNVDNDDDNDNKQNKSKIAAPKILNSRQHFVPHARLTGLYNISRGEGRVTEDTIRVSSEIKDSWGRRCRLSGEKSNSVQGFMPMGFLLVKKTQSI